MTSENEQVQPEELEEATAPEPARSVAAVRPVDPGSVHVLFEPETTKVVLTGEIDAELGPDLLEAAEDALSSSRPIEVDSHLVTFMDSTGVAFLARLASRASRRVMLVDPPDVVGFLIETTRISSLLDVVRRGTPTEATEG
jgi:anti-sigma B factor antagonist